MSDPVIVVGSGAAGLTAALTAARRHPVLLLTKGRLGDGNTRHAQGGIAAALFDDDSVEAHMHDTLVAGAFLGDPAAVRVLCEEGPDRIRDLVALGVPFDRDTAGGLSRGLEAAHSSPRILHAGGDTTGVALSSALVAAVTASPVRVMEHAVVTDILVDGGHAVGVDALLGGRWHRINGSSVIIATGGIGQLYQHTTNPLGATGDGVAAAHRAGARLADTEFVQFHPTALRVTGTPLVSEAVRGAGATLLDHRGERFMLHEHPDAELAPRDIVARAIAHTMQRTGAPVLLDARHLTGDLLESRFPGFSSLCRDHGLDPAREPVPVTPAAHYWMGGIHTDLHGRTSIPDLVAVGEAARTGVHGANRLASNSLLEALVFAHRTADALGEENKDRPRGTSTDAPHAQRDTRTDPETPRITRDEIQQLMWDHVGLVRTEHGLHHAERRLATTTTQPPQYGDDATPAERIRELETANLHQLARIITAAAIRRRESIGAHHRSDHPENSGRPAQATTVTTTREATLAC